MIESYFFESEEIGNEKRIFVLIIYDIVNNSRRTKLAKYMNGYGFRVQKSSFEAHLTEHVYCKLMREIPLLINEKEDSVRVYRITGCGEVKVFGIDDAIEIDDVIII